MGLPIPDDRDRTSKDRTLWTRLCPPEHKENKYKGCARLDQAVRVDVKLWICNLNRRLSRRVVSLNKTVVTCNRVDGPIVRQVSSCAFLTLFFFL